MRAVEGRDGVLVAVSVLVVVVDDDITLSCKSPQETRRAADPTLRDEAAPRFPLDRAGRRDRRLLRTRLSGESDIKAENGLIVKAGSGVDGRGVTSCDVTMAWGVTARLLSREDSCRDA